MLVIPSNGSSNAYLNASGTWTSPSFSSLSVFTQNMDAKGFIINGLGNGVLDGDSVNLK